MNSKPIRTFSGTALMLSAAMAATLPEAAQAAPPRVRVAGISRVNVVNVPTVNLNGTPTVRLETGSTVALQPGSAVSLQPGTTVQLQPGATVGLQPGASVSLQPGSTVGLQPGSTVSLPAGTKVGLDAGTTVKLDPTSTVSVRDDAARQAVQKAFTFSIAVGLMTDFETFPVPADKILVIEYLSCSAILPIGQFLYAELTTTAGGTGGLHTFVPAPSFLNGAFPHFILSVPTRLYADPGTTVRLNVVRTAALGSISDFPCTLSGYYVDA